MASNTRDVELIIRAKAEGERALKSITDGLKDLAGVQADLAKSGKQADGVLGDLGAELNTLSRQVQNLASFKTVVENVDKTGEAVGRLETRAKKTADELDLLAQKQVEAAAATARAKQAADEAAAAYDSQRQQAAAVRKEAGSTSEAYQQQAAALAVAKTARTEANAVLSAATKEEKRVQSAIADLTDSLTQQNANLDKARADWAALKQAAQLAGQSLGGVEADLKSVNAAAAQAAEKLALTKGAIDFRVEADNAKKLRDAADYIDFWTKALQEKEVAEKQAAQTTARFLQPSLVDQINQSLGIGRQPTRSAARSADTFAPLLNKQDLEQEAQAARDAAKAAEELAAAEALVKRTLDPLLPVRQNLEKQMAQVNLAYKQGRISATELAQAEKILKQNADEAAQALGRQSSSGGKGTFLGLRPYELQNLSYQVNDVFTQIGSGTPVMQVLAQQGGQVFQVFQRQLIPAAERLGPALLSASPAIAGLVIGVVALGAAFKNAADEAASIKQFAGELKSSADGQIYNAKALAETAHQLDVYGGSLQDARAELKQFVSAGLNPDLLEKFGRAAQNVADVTGKKIPEAAKLLADGFTGGYNSIKKLDDEFNFLTAAEREHIRAMFDSGDAARGRTEAFDIFYKKMKDGADGMKGPWGEALRNFSAAWNNLVEFIKNSAPVQAAIELISTLSKKIKDLTDLLPGAGSRSDGNTPGTTPETSRIERELTQLRERRARAAEREAAALVELDRAKKRTPELADQIQENFNKARARIDAGGSIDSTVVLDKEIAAKEARLGELKKSITDTKASGTENDKKVLGDVIDQLSEEELRRKQNLKTTTDADKVRIAGELAYRQSMRETADVAEETARKIAELRRKSAEDAVREQQANSFSASSYAKRVAGVESAGSNTAKNPLSTATGQGQFIESTWLSLFKKYFPSEAARMSDEAILELRKRQEYSLKLIEIYAQENAKVLQKAGASVNDASLYLAHFLGPGGAAKVLTAAPNTPVSQLLGADQIAANRSILEGKTAGQVVNFAQRKMGASEADREQLDAEAEVRNKLADANRKYNDSLDDASSKRQAEIGALKQLSDIENLSLEQKYAATRQAEIEKAVEDARQKASEAGTTLSKERETQIRSEVGALYDLKHAEELDNAVKKEKRDYIQNLIGLEQQRKTALQELNQELTSGTTDESRVAELRKTVADLNRQITDGIPKAREYAAALGDEKLVAQLDKVTLSLKNQQEQVKFSKEITSDLVSGLSSAFDSFAQQVANGVKPLQALRTAFLQFASDFLRQIAQMILKQALLNALGAKSDGTSSVGNIIGSAIAGIFHSGGVAGVSAAPSRSAPATWFANAARYHTGGLAGLAPNEVPAILQRNEEVLTTSDPRHRFNLGKGDAAPSAAAPLNVKVVNTIDAGDFVSQGLGTSVGEQAILNVIRANPGAFKAALG